MPQKRGIMKYDQIKNLPNEQFRRLTGVKRKTFEKMLEILREADRKKKAVGGRKNRLGIEDRLLMALEYIREYRTCFHIAKSYAVSESAVYKTVRWIEDTLIKDPAFALPGRKALLKSDAERQVILVDASEMPIERPKKSSTKEKDQKQEQQTETFLFRKKE